MKSSRFGVVTLLATVLLAGCGQTATSDASQPAGQVQPTRLDFSGLRRLIPGVLSRLGFSASSLLALNLRLHKPRLPLTLLVIAFLLLSLWIVLRDVAFSCQLAPIRRLDEDRGPHLPAA